MSNTLTIAVVGAGGKMGIRVSATCRDRPHRLLHRNLPARPAAGGGRRSAKSPTPTRRWPMRTSSSSRSQTGSWARYPTTWSPSCVPAHRAHPRPCGRLRRVAAPSGTTCPSPSPTPATRRCSSSGPTSEQWADTFGGIAAPQDVVAAQETGTHEQKAVAEDRDQGHVRPGPRRALGHREAARGAGADARRGRGLHDRRAC